MPQKKFIHHFHRKRIAGVIGFFVALYIIFLTINALSPFLYSNQVKLFMQQNGTVGVGLFIVLYTISQIFPVVPDFPLQVIGMGLFGVYKTVLIIYAVSVFSSLITFSISRIFGRKIVKKFIGESRLKRVTSVSKYLGVQELIIIRLFEVSVFEWISYAAGLTDLSVVTYFIVTIIATIPYYVVLYLLSQYIHDLGHLYVSISLVGYVGALVPIPYFIFSRRIRKNKNKEN